MGKIFLPKTLHRIWDLNSAIKNGLTFRQANSEGKHSGKTEQREQRHFLRWFTKFSQIWSLLKCPDHNYLHDIFRGGKSLNTPWRPYILFVQLHGGGNLLPLPISVSSLKVTHLSDLQKTRCHHIECVLYASMAISDSISSLKILRELCFRRYIVLCGVTWMTITKMSDSDIGSMDTAQTSRLHEHPCLLPLGLLSIQVSSMN